MLVGVCFDDYRTSEAAGEAGFTRWARLGAPRGAMDGPPTTLTDRGEFGL